MIGDLGKRPPLTALQIQQVQKFMNQTCGISLKNKEYLINSKLGFLFFARKISSFAEFWKQMMKSDDEGMEMRQDVVDALTTNYSYFYREEEHFHYLQKLLWNHKLPHSPDGICRAWSAGCSSGQEAYNIAMLLEDAQALKLLPGPYEVRGSDVSKKVIGMARNGRYNTADYVRLPEHWRNRYTWRLPEGCEVKKHLRDRVKFQVESVLNPVSPRLYHFIFCRNMIIYLDEESTRRAIDTFRKCLLPGGYLFLGHTEILNDLPGFTYLVPSIYQKKGGMG